MIVQHKACAKWFNRNDVVSEMHWTPVVTTNFLDDQNLFFKLFMMNRSFISDND